MESIGLITNTINFESHYNEGGRVEVEFTARQRTEPIPGPSGIHVAWDICRGIAEVRPVLKRTGHVARQQFVVIFEGRESPSTSLWYVCEASDVQSNTKHLMGTGKSPAEAFADFCMRAETVLSDSPQAVEQAANYGDSEVIGNMKSQALRCFKKDI
jgi:hypothetical protein